MSRYKEIVITPRELRDNKVLYKRVVFEKKINFLLSGRIVNENRVPIVGAIIAIIQIKKINCEIIEEQYGYLITSGEGRYCTVLPCNCNIDYRLEVYEPMIRCK